MAFRVLVVAGESTGSRCADDLRSFGWEAEVVEAIEVVSRALAFRPHAAVIDLSFDPAAGVNAGFALRSIPDRGRDVKRLHGLPLFFVGANDHLRDQIRARVPASTFVTAGELAGELWQLRGREER